MILIWSLLVQLILVGAYIMQEPLRLRKAWFSPEDCGKDRTVVESLHNSCFTRMKLAVMGPKNKDLEELRNISVYNETRASQRIYGGRDTQNGQFPWTVRLAWGNQPNNGHCSGSIIHERFILTAAHCIWGHGGKDLYIYVGVDPPIPEQLSSVAYEEFWPHPCYWLNTSGRFPPDYTGPEHCPEIAKNDLQVFDVGLILLRNSLTNSNGRWPVHDSNAQDTYFKYNSVCLSEEIWPLDYDEVYQHSGWGIMKAKDSVSSQFADRLQWIKYIIKDTSFDGVEINFHNALGHTACQIDSGSPIVVQNFDGRYYQRSVMSGPGDEEYIVIPGHGIVPCSKAFSKTIDIYYPDVKNWIWEAIRNFTQKS